MKKLKADGLVIGIILMAALLFFIVPYVTDTAEIKYVTVLQNGTVLYRYPLSVNRTLTVTDKDDNYNLVMIGDGSVRVTDASCPDQLCVKQREISRGGESIICLPHKLVVEIEAKEESSLDAVAN